MASCSDPANAAALRLTPSDSDLASQAPLLLLVPRDDRTTESPVLFHLPLRRYLRFHLPLTGLLGSSSRVISLGCRVLICDCLSDPRRCELRLVHLLTGERTRFPNLVGSYWKRFVLSGVLLLAWGYFESTIQFCLLGDAEWRVASLERDSYLEDVICVNGTIYVLLSTNHRYDKPTYLVASVKLSVFRSIKLELEFLGDALDARSLHLPVGTPLTLYLAECRGELIVVSDRCDLTVGSKRKRVYHALQWKSREAKWVRITNLGGCALFFGDPFFVSSLGPDHPGIRKDCLYFTEEGSWSEYSLVDGSFRRSDAIYPEGKSQGDFSAPVWILPSMC